MSVRRARYQPPLNSQCLCGSGLKFKRCCLGIMISHARYILTKQMS
ncbi:SEC-C domain-containing protein [Aeromonas hydrophila]|uniref:SEC-C domain-containing protein n=1 Tax=Aeromonas hydrophila TaxID=644 RepID=A0A926FJS2_AERHY|nr:SEC-C domain-containing protein [Aeromonas hydrophila]